METIETMLRSHPHAAERQIDGRVEAIDALTACAEVCTSCADACLGESGHLESLRRCVRINFDCSAVCTLTAELVARQTDTPDSLVHAQLHACVIACQLCADECKLHAARHRHCRICFDVCQECQQRCNYLLGELSSSGIQAYGAEDEDYSHPFDNPGL